VDIKYNSHDDKISYEDYKIFTEKIEMEKLGYSFEGISY